MKKIEDAILYLAKTKKIEIPSTIQSINGGAFDNADNLAEIIIDKKNDGTLTGAPWKCTYGLRAIKWKE